MPGWSQNEVPDPGCAEELPREMRNAKGKGIKYDLCPGVSSIKPEKLTSAMNCVCKGCAPASNRYRQSPKAENQVDPQECEKCEKIKFITGPRTRICMVYLQPPGLWDSPHK